jgi:hypothetical protein
VWRIRASLRPVFALLRAVGVGVKAAAATSSARSPASAACARSTTTSAASTLVRRIFISTHRQYRLNCSFAVVVTSDALYAYETSTDVIELNFRQQAARSHF